MVVDRPGRPDEDSDPVTVFARVDSGAYRSSFPRQIAFDLGIQEDELVEDAHGGIGVGSHFRVWTTDLPIRADIGLFEPDENGEDVGWGPGFGLNPAFTEHDAFLLGRADFFQAFTVTFETRPNGTQVFHLDAPDDLEEPEELDALPGGA